MTTQISGDNGILGQVGGTTFRGLHTHLKPIEYGALGHYRVNHRCALVNTQAANSRLLSLRNTHASNLIILTRLQIKWMQTGAHTAAIEDSIDVFKVTGFTAVDNTNVVTPTASRLRTTMAAAPGGAAVTGVTVAGAAAGMTGGTLTKDGGSVGQLPAWLLAAQPTGSQMWGLAMENFADILGAHPFVFAQNEGLIVENRVLLGAAAASTVYLDMEWAEVTAY